MREPVSADVHEFAGVNLSSDWASSERQRIVLVIARFLSFADSLVECILNSTHSVLPFLLYTTHLHAVAGSLVEILGAVPQ